MSGISERNPFVGPRPIQRGEPLYGRDLEIRELYNRLQARRLVVLHSPSGAGKSSLVQAGLVPRLIDAGYDVWKPIRVNLDPGDLGSVPEGTNRYLLSAMISLEDELPEASRRSPGTLAGLDFREYLEKRPRRKGRGSQPVVLIFDQFEEVLTVAALAVDAKRAFFAAVGQALEAEKYWALFLIREDHLGALAPYRDRVPTQLSNTFRLDLLGLEGARAAAKNLAEQGGRGFPAVDQLIRDLSTVQVQQADGSFLAEPGLYVEPVQLQVVCRRLWDAMPADRLSIDQADIEAYASVSSALGSYYADALRSIAAGDVATERALREWVGTKLIVGGIRSQVRQEAGKSAGLDNVRIRQLLDSYLVRTEQRAGVHWFELSHDRLVEPVQLDNKAWETNNLHPLQVQARLWEDSHRSAALLLGVEALRSAQTWAQAHQALLTEGEREFLALSQEQRERDNAARRRLVALAAVAGVVAVVVGVLAAVAWAAQQAAVDAKEEADKQLRAAQAAGLTAKEAKEDADRQRNAAVVEKDGAELARKIAKAAEATAVTARKENERLLQDMFRAALRSLIVNRAREGSLSGEVVVDNRWSPLLEHESPIDGKKQRFAAFTVIGDAGRIVVAGHDAVLSAADKGGYSAFLEMTSKWLLGEQKQGRVIVLADGDRKSPTLAKLAKNLATLKYEHTIKSSFDDLSDAGMLIVANRHQDFTDDEIQAIKDFIARGGGMLAVGVGWSWIESKAAKGKAPHTPDNYPMNRLMDGFGARWNDKKIEGLEQPPEPRVTLYEGRFYEGASQSFGVGSHDVHTFKRIGDNRVSSVKVDAGLRVTLYEDIGFKGNTLPLAADTTHLEYFEDLCSGIKVERVRPNEALKVNAMQAAIQASPAPPDEAVFYESADFTGRATSYGVGRHTNLGLGDDQISSVKVPSGMKVTLYENADFTGRKEVLRYDTQSLPRFNDMCSAIEVQQLTAAERVPLNFGNTGIYFDLDKDTIKPRSRPVLDRFVAVLKEFTFIRIEIAGHTASIGSRAYNMDISRRRAQSVKRYLVEHGIDENRIETRGAGPDEPVADNDTPAGRAKNNRIEMQRIDD